MRKSIIVSNLLTLFVLGYYAIVKGMDWIIGLALLISIASNTLNIMCEVRYGGKEEQTTR